MAKEDKSAAAPAAAVVRLTHGEARAPYVSTVVLESGMQVAYRDGEPVSYDGDSGKFVNAFASQCAPARVKIDEFELGKKKIVADGQTVEVPVMQRTLRLMDG
jgi:hypothetical protein